jgi:hypothetical protein
LIPPFYTINIDCSELTIARLHIHIPLPLLANRNREIAILKGIQPLQLAVGLLAAIARGRCGVGWLAAHCDGFGWGGAISLGHRRLSQGGNGAGCNEERKANKPLRTHKRAQVKP